MRAKAIGIAVSLPAAAALLAWGIGACIPYVTAPESEAWTDSAVPDHLAVAFFGEEADSSTNEYTFSLSVGGLARLALSAKLSQGTATVTVREKVSGTVLVDTRADPGFGPNLRCDFVYLTSAGEYIVKAETRDAVGQVSLNLDYVSTPIGFSWDAQFPDVYDLVASRTEVYTWNCPTGTTPDLQIRVSAQDATQTTTFEIRDALNALVRPADTFTGNGVGGPEQVLNVPNLTGAAGQWKVTITHAAQGNDASMRMTLTP
ncbi:MAG: hypothetical protein MUC63_08770 [Planctomycetes bacterium]|nr:hypothetical protein [Planctomycetota bacterium]